MIQLTPPLRQTKRGIPRDVGQLVAMLSQGFGGNVEWYKEWSNGKILNGHTGLDWPCKRGEPIIASHDGVVAHATQDSFGGLYVKLEQGNWGTLYGHFYKFAVKEGQEVKRGTVLGYANSTGLSTGDHLHFALKVDGKWTDPVPHLVWFGTISSDNMSEILVKKMYRLLFYRDPTKNELDYWVGKPVESFVTQVAADRAKFLME